MEDDSKKFVVLAADDDENAHLLLQHAFKKLKIHASLQQVMDGCEVIDYLNGKGPFADRFKYPIPNLLLLDLKMPKVSGFGVLEHLRSNPLLVKFPVVVFSSSDAEIDIKRATELGCEDFRVKPTSFDKLLELVNNLQETYLTSSKKKAPDKADSSQVKSIATAMAIPIEPSSPLQVIEQPGSRQPPTISTKGFDSGFDDIFRLLVEQVKDYAISYIDKEGKIVPGMRVPGESQVTKGLR